jgi:hypothetical protein
VRAHFASTILVASALLTQACAFMTNDFGPKRLAAADADAVPERASCPTRWLEHTHPQVRDEGLGDLVFAEHGIDLGDAADGGENAARIGVDLAATRPPCTNPTSGTIMNVEPGAGSNAFGRASYAWGLQGTPASTFINQTANAGVLALLFRLVGYNGQPDDDDVELDMTHGSASAPTWQGEDVWSPAEAYTQHGADGYRAKAAARTRVSGGQIEVELATVPGTPAVSNARLRATIAQRGARWHLSGVLTGVVRSRELLGFAGMLGLCMGTPMYASYKQAYCANADAVLDAGGVCDALSVAWRFEADSARLGCIRPVEPSVALCIPAEDPSSDQCGP